MARPLQEGLSPAAPIESTRGEGTACIPVDAVSSTPCALPFVSCGPSASDFTQWAAAQHRASPLQHSAVCCGQEAHHAASTASCGLSASNRSRGTTITDPGSMEAEESGREDRMGVNPAARAMEGVTANGRILAEPLLLDEQAAGAIAAQLRVIGDEMEEMFRQRRPAAGERRWDPWWQYLYDVLSEALAVFWDPRVDIAQ
ncbi:uncharacterized protein LOC115100891 isoform X2 [Rhinatrema bivittatum]|nr:uncharacterized protein LOC115100891 isoform X2 [Rhinatrema bivittatum]